MATTVGEYIKRDHDDFRLIFAWLRKSTVETAALREEVYPFLVARVHAHAVAEEATIFPQMERTPELLADTLALIAGHRGMDMLADDLAGTPLTARLWESKLVPLLDLTSCHLSREEADVFPRATCHFTQEALEAAGEEFERVLQREWQIAGVHGGLPPAMRGR
ncbi:MAG: hemerythrin domain-containing protein [Methanospirillum sp.]